MIIQPEEIGTRLQEIERDLAETSFLTNEAKPKIIAKLKIIRTNINNSFLKLADLTNLDLHMIWNALRPYIDKDDL